MSQVNILIAINIEKMQTTPYSSTEKGEYEITNAKDCIFMHDDQSDAYYKSGSGKSELNSTVSAGSLITWTLLSSDIKYLSKIELVAIVDTTEYKTATESRLFVCAPFIFCNNKRACAGVSDNIRTVEDSYYYSYVVKFKIDDKIYFWDPFMDPRGDDDGDNG